MKFNSKMIAGQLIIKTKFAWIPIKIEKETRWLETVHFIGSYNRYGRWYSNNFVDDPNNNRYDNVKKVNANIKNLMPFLWLIGYAFMGLLILNLFDGESTAFGMILLICLGWCIFFKVIPEYSER